MKKTWEEYVKDFKAVHGELYIYPREQELIEGNLTKVKITCREHGEFLQQVHNHKRGRGCRSCQYKLISETTKNTTEMFTERSSEVHCNFYSYEKANYTGSHIKLIVTCPYHGDFLITPDSHLQGHGCAKCSGNLKSNTKDFIKKSTKIHKDKYTYDKVEYVGAHEKVIINCSKHGDFKIIPASHLAGRGCRKCGYENTGRRLTKQQELLDCITYFVKFENKNSGKVFYKIGITIRSVEERLSSSKQEGYSYETLAVYRDIGKNCQSFEDELLDHLKKRGQYRKVRDLRNTYIGGWTECFACDIVAGEVKRMFEERSSRI